MALCGMRMPLGRNANYETKLHLLQQHRPGFTANWYIVRVELSCKSFTVLTLVARD